jgi:hypothetical protein
LIGEPTVVDDANGCLLLERVCDSIEIYGTVSLETASLSKALTYGTLVAQWVKAVERVSVLLLVAPDQVYPCR